MISHGATRRSDGPAIPVRLKQPRQGVSADEASWHQYTDAAR